MRHAPNFYQSSQVSLKRKISIPITPSPLKRHKNPMVSSNDAILPSLDIHTPHPLSLRTTQHFLPSTPFSSLRTPQHLLPPPPNNPIQNLSNLFTPIHPHRKHPLQPSSLNPRLHNQRHNPITISLSIRRYRQKWQFLLLTQV